MSLKAVFNFQFNFKMFPIINRVFDNRGRELNLDCLLTNLRITEAIQHQNIQRVAGYNLNLDSSLVNSFGLGNTSILSNSMLLGSPMLHQREPAANNSFHDNLATDFFKRTPPPKYFNHRDQLTKVEDQETFIRKREACRAEIRSMDQETLNSLSIISTSSFCQTNVFGNSAVFNFSKPSTVPTFQRSKVLTSEEYDEMRADFDANGRDVTHELEQENHQASSLFDYSYMVQQFGCGDRADMIEKWIETSQPDKNLDLAENFPPLAPTNQHSNTSLSGVATPQESENVAKTPELNFQGALKMNYKPDLSFEDSVTTSDISNKKEIKGKPPHCVFCKNNKETEEVYMGHILKTAKGKVVCPRLREYVCPICSATGDNGNLPHHVFHNQIIRYSQF